ncbi:threonine ammonia-lyase [Hyphomonas pacifica]|uniref:Threonine dehydratase n=1 Tax=Hyphomonas pacifica TaxID=1280941 RepID=A0A062TX66_9PROT|nr:threonine ammonia-lyase [Hyphomonas pacifica]KCZ50612.1 threonine dehydratase [Hyphomonas pacifica]RAN33037.1 threonine dehydratase [Hyphomonas pacifica]RAN37593.1 threonine dehydratase [Hyphomonas pacifica]
MPDTQHSDLPVTLSDVEAAASVLEGQIVHTPMTMSRTLSAITGAEVWVKFENHQFTAAFKERGALNKLSKLTDEQKKRGVIAASAGNHSQGVAYHARRLGIPATIVMAETTPFSKVEHTRNHGARVLLEGLIFDEAKQFALDLCERENLTFIHPFDDEDIIAGQGTVALEMLETNPDLDTLVVPIGGGGLISGIAVAAKALKPDIKIIGVESAMYPCMHAALNGKSPKTGGATIAEGIAVKEAGLLTRKFCQKLVDDIVLVEEEHLERAITLYAEVEKTIAEGAGAAGLAALLAHPSRFYGRKVGLVLCGGNIDTRLLSSVLTRALVRENRLASIRIIGDDRPGLLALVSKIIGDAGANIMEVAHNRIALDVPAKGAEFDILIETRDSQHTQEVIDALAQAGYPPRSL